MHSRSQDQSQTAGELNDTASGLQSLKTAEAPESSSRGNEQVASTDHENQITEEKEQTREKAFLKISTEIEIAAPPAVVRSKFLDFSTLPLYQRPSGLIRSLKLLTVGKTGMDLEPGDKMKACLGGMNVTLVVVENNETTFSWYGAWPSQTFCLLSGIHSFKFLPSVSSTTSSPSTLLRQEEQHEGILAGVMKLEKAIKKANDGNMGFNEDLKIWIERNP